jgi:hypothetical protein
MMEKKRADWSDSAHPRTVRRRVLAGEGQQGRGCCSCFVLLLAQIEQSNAEEELRPRVAPRSSHGIQIIRSEND